MVTVSIPCRLRSSARTATPSPPCMCFWTGNLPGCNLMVLIMVRLKPDSSLNSVRQSRTLLNVLPAILYVRSLEFWGYLCSSLNEVTVTGLQSNVERHMLQTHQILARNYKQVRWAIHIKREKSQVVSGSLVVSPLQKIDIFPRC
jgi:hypothetical protein